MPGTKATLADLAFLRAQGWDVDLAAHIRRGADRKSLELYLETFAYTVGVMQELRRGLSPPSRALRNGRGAA